MLSPSQKSKLVLLFALLLVGPLWAQPMLQQPAPHFELAELMDSDRLRSLDEWQGQVVLLDFWASWCAPCRESLPEYQTLADELQQLGFDFEVVGINLDHRLQAGQAFWQAMDLSFPSLWASDQQQLSEHYAIIGLPSAFLLDSKHRIVHIYQGVASKEQIKAQVIALDRQQEPPSAPAPLSSN